MEKIWTDRNRCGYIWLCIYIYICIYTHGRLHLVVLMVWLVIWWELLVQQRDGGSTTGMAGLLLSEELRFSCTWLGLESPIDILKMIAMHYWLFETNLGLGMFGLTKWLGFFIYFFHILWHLAGTYKMTRHICAVANSNARTHVKPRETYCCWEQL